MKRFLMVFGVAMIAALFVVSSCKKDDEKQEQSLLIGKWEHSGNIIVNQSGEERADNYDEEVYCLPLHEFLSGGKYLYYNDHKKVNGICNYDDIYEEIWKIVDGKLYIYSSDKDETPSIYNIEKLTENELNLSYDPKWANTSKVIEVYRRK